MPITTKQRIQEHLADPVSQAYIANRIAQIDKQVRNKAMPNLQQQLNEQLDRIFWLCEGKIKRSELLKIRILDVRFVGMFPTEFSMNNPTVKREILASIFEARDEKGEYILKEGGLANPELKEYRKEIEFAKKVAEKLHGISRDDWGDYEYALGNANAEGYFQAKLELAPQTLRDLFFANCFGRSEKEIENLKLIKW